MLYLHNTTQKHQHKHFKNILNAYFTPTQIKDTRFIPPPTLIPLTHISITKCNLGKDIITKKATIQTQHALTHIYDDTDRHLITIVTTRLQWLWQQCNNSNHNTHGLVPPSQSFETELIWLYQRYKYKIPNKDPLKASQHTLPTTILDTFITTFNISHSYFSLLVICSTYLKQFHSPFTRDKKLHVKISPLWYHFMIFLWFEVHIYIHDMLLNFLSPKFIKMGIIFFVICFGGHGVFINPKEY